MAMVPYRTEMVVNDDDDENEDDMTSRRPLRDDPDFLDPQSNPFPDPRTNPYRDNSHPYEPSDTTSIAYNGRHRQQAHAPEEFEDEPLSEYGGDDPRNGKNNSDSNGTKPKKKSKNGNKKKKSKKGSGRKADRSGTVPYTGTGYSGGNGGFGTSDDPSRQHKHSTANKSEPGRWKKYCWLFLMFVLVLLFMIAMNMLMQHFFFGKKSDNADMSEYIRDPNSTFPLEKRDIDSACSRGSLAADEGASCRNVCLPVYYECCDPFNEFVLFESYNTVPPSRLNSSTLTPLGNNDNDDKYPGGLDAGDFRNRFNGTLFPTQGYSTLAPSRYDRTNSSSRPSSAPTDSGNPIRRFLRRVANYDATTFQQQKQQQPQQQMLPSDSYLVGDDESRRDLQDTLIVPVTVAPVWWNEHKDRMNDLIKARENLTCTLDNELQGCMRYAKCQAALGRVDPAPATLADLCSFENIQKDPISCQSVCIAATCCYATDSTNCIAKQFDMCLDYAPCQNLRRVSQQGDETGLVPSAPRTLEIDCFYQQPGCFDACIDAECCSDRRSTCFQTNFISCLTYAPCNNITRTTIHVPKQFNTVELPPDEILQACDPKRTDSFVIDPSKGSCSDICEKGPATCCWANVDSNCFMDDPLGCLVWMSQCQVLLENPDL